MEFRRVNSADDPAFAEAFALYGISFPTHEQRILDKQKALMSDPLYNFTVITEDGVFAGIILYWAFSGYVY